MENSPVFATEGPSADATLELPTEGFEILRQEEFGSRVRSIVVVYNDPNHEKRNQWLKEFARQIGGTTDFVVYFYTPDMDDEKGPWVRATPDGPEDIRLEIYDSRRQPKEEDAVATSNAVEMSPVDRRRAQEISAKPARGLIGRPAAEEFLGLSAHACRYFFKSADGTKIVATNVRQATSRELIVSSLEILSTNPGDVHDLTRRVAAFACGEGDYFEEMASVAIRHFEIHSEDHAVNTLTMRDLFLTRETGNAVVISSHEVPPQFPTERIVRGGTGSPIGTIKAVRPSYEHTSTAYSESRGTGKVYVKGYYRKDGTYVKPHYRSR